MIGCDFCEEWFHPDCLSLSTEEANMLTEREWKCPVCEGHAKIDYDEEKRAEKLATLTSKDDKHSQIPRSSDKTYNEQKVTDEPKRTKVNVGPGEWLWLVGDQLIAPTDEDLILER